MKEKRIKLGAVGVDSGQLMIADPCYLNDWKDNDFEDTPEKAGDFDYNGVSQLTMKADHTKDNEGQINFEMGHAGRAVAFRSGLGDGLYEVWATVKDFPDWGRRITKVEIILIEEESEHHKKLTKHLLGG